MMIEDLVMNELKLCRQVPLLISATVEVNMQYMTEAWGEEWIWTNTSLNLQIVGYFINVNSLFHFVFFDLPLSLEKPY